MNLEATPNERGAQIERFLNELGHEIIMSVTADEDSILIQAQGPDSNVWHRWTRLEAKVLFSLLGDALWPGEGSAVDAESLARSFHETYERLAPSFGYETREASAKPWANVPEQNKRLMIAVCGEILGSPAWKCGARSQYLPEPGDCDWPFCGCDPYANKVIEAIEESGRPKIAVAAKKADES